MSNAVDLLRQFARRWAMLNRLDPDALIGGGRLDYSREGRVRDQFCFVASNFARARDDLVGEALSLQRPNVFAARRRYWERHKSNPALAAFADLQVQALSRRDPAFFETLLAAVKVETDRRALAARESRALTFAANARVPEIEARRRAALASYFDGGGREALADRSRGNRWAAKPPP